MAEPTATKLYSPRLLALSANLANHPLDQEFRSQAQTHSRTCGSTIHIGLDTDDAGQITRIGMQIAACAVGQSSAAILAQSAKGQSPSRLAKLKSEIEQWLSNGGSLPDWPEIDALEPALAYPGRHEAILLPWRAATQALSTAR